MFVRNRMTTKVVTVAPDQTVPDVQGILSLYSPGSYTHLFCFFAPWLFLSLYP